MVKAPMPVEPAQRRGLLGALGAFACRRPRMVAAAGIALGLAALIFAIARFSLTSDTSALISRHLAWRQREAAFNRLFHPGGDEIVVVIDGATPELAED